MKIFSFTFGPFQENTYLLTDKTGECIIVDPGCFTFAEQQELKSFIQNHQLKPVQLLNTHCHLDHVAGNRFIYDEYQLLPVIHPLDLPVLEMQENSSRLYGLPCDKSPAPKNFFKDKDRIKFGETELEVHFAPGHSPGHVVFFNSKTKALIGGDLLFRGSIGRTDLPGGNHETLIHSIKNVLFPLGDDVIVNSGHGPETTIGHERMTNPFLI